jgi:hypothetical protein
VGSSASNYLRIDGSTGNRAFLGVESGAAVIYAQDNSGGNAPITFNTGSSERMQIDSSGRLLVGTSSSNSSFNSGCQIAGTGLGGTQLINRFDASVGGPILYFAKSRNATVGSNTIVQSGDILGSLEFYGANGTGYNAGAQIRAFVDGAPGAINDMPGRLVFSTSADNSSSPTERMRIDSSGKIRTPAGSSTRIGVDDRTSAGNGGNLIISAGSGSGSGNTAGNLILATSRGLGAAPTGEIKFGYNDGLNGLDLDGSGEWMRIDSSGLTLADSGSCGLTLRSATDNFGRIYFSDGTSGDAEYRGIIQYDHTNNRMQFAANASTAMTVDSSGRVGIGTSSPARQLTLYNSSTPIIQLVNSTTGQTANDGVMQRAVIDSSGRLLVGVSASNANPNADDVQIGTRATSADVGITLGSTSSGSIRFAATDNSAGMINYNHSENSMRFSTDSNECLRIDSSGRLLVGTSSARSLNDDTQLLQVEAADGSGTGRIADNVTGAGIYLFRSRGGTLGSNTIVQDNDDLGSIYFHGADGTDANSRAAQIRCEVDGTPGTNDMPGRLVFSTTAASSSSPTERMRIPSTGNILTYSDNNMQIKSGNTGATLRALSVSTGATSVTTGSLVFQVMADGDVENTNGVYGAISDLKLKENIVDAGSQWDDIKSLQVRKYNFKENTGLSTHTQIGLVAQEVELVSPGLVGESPDIDEEGKNLGTTTKSVSYSVLYMKAVKALQEAMERIETLEQRLTDAGL